MKSPITTHILDTAAGSPAAGVEVLLERLTDDGTFVKVAEGQTNDDGRILDWFSRDNFSTGNYRISFAVDSYFKGDSFFPSVEIQFIVSDTNQHYHVPLLLSPYGYSTYRGS